MPDDLQRQRWCRMVGGLVGVVYWDLTVLPGDGDDHDDYGGDDDYDACGDDDDDNQGYND